MGVFFSRRRRFTFFQALVFDTRVLFNMAENTKMHVSILEKDGCLEQRQLAFGFGCPLCPNFKVVAEGVIQRHLGNHITNGVHFQDYIICRCNLPCRAVGHFHCPFCFKTITRKEHMTSHLRLCPKKSTVVQPMPLASCKPISQESQSLKENMVYSEHSYFLAIPEISQDSDHSYAQPESPKTPAFATDIDQSNPASTPNRSLIPEDFNPQHKDFSPQEENLTPQQKNVTPQEENLTPQQKNVTPQEENLTPQQKNVTPQEVVFIPEEKGLTLQKEDFTLPSTHIKCPHCPLSLYKQNLAVHIKRMHTQLEDVTASSHLKTVCVDQINGIYAVRKTSHGFSVPVHVQRKTWGQDQHTKCELEDCRQYHLLARRSGLPHSMCHHVRSVDYCSATATGEPLQQQVLDEMVENHFFGLSKVNVCKKRQRESEEAHVPLSVFVNLSDSKNNICFSIYEPKLHHYSTLGRVIVTHNTKKNSWHCPCAKARTSCTHKSIAKWHLFQTHKHLFVTTPLSNTTSQSTPHPSHSPTTDLARIVKYVFEFKKIPATLPEEVTAQRALPDYRKHLLPDESTCRLCPDHPELQEATLVTNKARIVGMQGVIQNVSTYKKRCPSCKLFYRYQEWRDGLHNFNDHVIITLQLCVYLRHNLQNHVSVSRVINSLESLLRVEFPATDLIFQGYCHFEALSNTEYTYSCVNCGFYPPVVVMDLHRKGVFSFEVSELEQPGSEFHGEHNIVSFWESVHLHMISRGFFKLPSQNPFVVSPSYENWAPWIGVETRSGNTVLNTEFQKVPQQRSTGEPQLDNVTEDRLVDELLKQKLSTIRKLCKSCNMDTKGSRMDLINRLRGEMKSRQTYDKVFQSVWGASGGWSVIMCPHGIVYSVKFNLRAESPRDYADLLLSWKHLPNVCIYDFARGLVAHANLRFPETPPFQPFEGRLAEPTSNNVEAASHGNLKVQLPWLLEKLPDSEEYGHPVTGSSKHFVLYDKFHQDNTKDPLDVLRRIDIVPELQGTLNSQVAEQLFACLRKNNYFLNNMGPSAHIFLMRNIIEHRNVNLNEKMIKRQLRRGVQQMKTMTQSPLGQVILGQETSHDTQSLAKETNPKTQCQVESDVATPETVSLQSDEERLHCGPHCASLTELDNVEAERSCWSFDIHQNQEQVLQYILDTRSPGNELLVQTERQTCLTRSDFLTLGLRREVESTILNACFEMMERIALSKGKDVYTVDLYVSPTWLPPMNVDPMASLPSQAHLKDFILFPLWTPGHFQICVIKPEQKEILFLDSLYAQTNLGFRAQQFIPLLRAVALKICPGAWTELTGKDLVGFPKQDSGVDCGVFMLMAALYIVLGENFDYSIHDMPVLRRWWCLLLLENNSLNGYGQLFAHWTTECQDLLDGKHAPVIRLKRKRVQNPETERVCMADPLKFCIFQTSKKKTQDKDSCTQMLNLFSGCSAKPAADGFTRTALETGDYSKVLENESFDCGCTDLPDSTGFGKSVEEEDILSLFPADMIKALHEDLTTGKLRSNRMYLWQNPMSSLTLKQDLKLRTLNLSDQRIFQLLRTIEEATGVGSLIRQGEIQLLDYVFDVMLPEVRFSMCFVKYKPSFR
uniref:Uncharacterized LOC112141289 n=1 Tax=Oryzias melastigma TaxID=30732 RepID=A0A3B3BZI3_ORYME